MLPFLEKIWRRSSGKHCVLHDWACAEVGRVLCCTEFRGRHLCTPEAFSMSIFMIIQYYEHEVLLIYLVHVTCGDLNQCSSH